MKFELEKFNRNTDEKELLKDLKKIHTALKKDGLALTYRSYNEIGKYSSATISTRFGSWNKALLQADLGLNEEKSASDRDLFLNLEDVWMSLGRQPVSRDLVKPQSKYGSQMYSHRFGGWRKALEAFVEYINEDEITKDIKHQPVETNNFTNKKVSKKRRTNRNISDRLRFSILMRDGFTCQSCGANPTNTLGVKLHVDHIIPWSKGGETEETNLQTKCKQCNLGKGNAFNK